MISIESIFENYINGNRLDAMIQIKSYGELRFFQEFREWLYEMGGDWEIMYERFTDIVITYFTHKN